MDLGHSAYDLAHGGVSIEPVWSLPYSGCLGITTDLCTIEVIVGRREIYLIGSCGGEDESVTATSLLLLSVLNVYTLQFVKGEHQET